MRRIVVAAALAIVLCSGTAAAQGPDYTGGVSLSCSPDVIVVGDTIACTASGFMPNSEVSFQINPPLGTATANVSGVASVTATVPSLAPGSYSVTATGTGGDGTAGAQATTNIELVSGSAAAVASGAATPGDSATTGSGLPVTGGRDTVPITVIAIVLITAGALLVLGVRKATAKAH